MEIERREVIDGEDLGDKLAEWGEEGDGGDAVCCGGVVDLGQGVDPVLLLLGVGCWLFRVGSDNVEVLDRGCVLQKPVEEVFVGKGFEVPSRARGFPEQQCAGQIVAGCDSV